LCGISTQCPFSLTIQFNSIHFHRKTPALSLKQLKQTLSIAFQQSSTMKAAALPFTLLLLLRATQAAPLPAVSSPQLPISVYRANMFSQDSLQQREPLPPPGCVWVPNPHGAGQHLDCAPEPVKPVFPDPDDPLFPWETNSDS